MDEPDIQSIIENMGRGLPRFPDGRINYTDAQTCPVVTVFVMQNGKLFLAKRSDKVGTYQGKWNTIAGYLDRVEPLQAKVLEELFEELGVEPSAIASTKYGPMTEISDPAIDRTWVTFPVLVELQPTTAIRIDWEHTAYQWIEPDVLTRFDLVPGVVDNFKKLMS